MSATVLRFDNRTTRIPGAYTRVDASALDQPPPGATGTVLVIGQADGGAPYTAVTADTAAAFTSAPALSKAYLSGDLKEGGLMCFTPSKSPDISGAQTVKTLKVNPDTGSSVTLANGFGNALTVSSLDYGPSTNQIAVAIAAGTVQGYKVTITHDGLTEYHDNIGGLPMITLSYTAVPGLGWGAMTANVTTSGITAAGSLAQAGLNGDLQNPSTTAALEVFSSSAGDTTQTLTIYGLASGVATARQVTLNGTTHVPVTGTFDANGIMGVVLSGVSAGNVTVRHTTPTTLFVITAGNLAAGGIARQSMFMQGALSMVASGSSTAQVFIAGRNASGAVVLEVRALNNTTSVSSLTTNWAQIDFIGLALVSTVTVTFSGTAAQTLHTVQSTLRKVSDFFNAKQLVVSSVVYGFSATVNTTRTTYNPANLDLTQTPVNMFNPATAGLRADLALMAEALTNDSTVVSAAAVGGAFGVPSNTTTPAYLSGGSTVAPTSTDWQNALNLARDIDLNTIVVLTSDPAVHAMLSAHLDWRAGAGKAEADAYIGIQNSGMTGPAPLSQIQSQIVALNNRNINVAVQTIDRFDSTATRTTFQPMFTACVMAGAQAGAPLGRALTNAYLNVLAFGQHSSWNPTDNSEDLIAAGATILQTKKNKGIYVVRGVTSAVGSDNPVFTDTAANRILNYCTKTLRDDIEDFIGQDGVQPTQTAILGRARKQCDSFVSVDKVLRGYRNLEVDLTLDQAPITVDMAPAFSINFAPITINLYDAPITG